MNTGHYIEPKELVFNAAAFAGDMEHRVIPRGVYLSWIRDAFQELNMATRFSIQTKNFDFPINSLSLPLPEDCFDVKSIFMYTGDECTFEAVKEVHHKKNYYTQGNGSFSHNRAGDNQSPIYPKSVEDSTGLLWYGLQMGNIMFSPTCRTAGAKVHIEYYGTGSDVMDSAIIPIYFRQAIEDYITEAALRMRMANDPMNARSFMAMQQTYERRLDKNGMRGSWHEAKILVKSMNSGQRQDMNNYLSRGGWMTGR